MREYKRLCSHLFIWLLAGPAIAAAQKGDVFDLEGHRVVVQARGGWVEFDVAGLPRSAPPLAPFVQTLSMTPDSGAFRAFVHPDSLATLLDSADAIAVTSPATPYPVARPPALGTAAEFTFSLFPRLSWNGDSFMVTLQGCSMTRVSASLDTLARQRMVSSMRRAIAAARLARRRGTPSSDPGVACPPRLLARSVIVPALTRRQIGTAEPEDFVAELSVDSAGRVRQVRLPRWNGRTEALRVVDSAMRRWRFQPATGPMSSTRAARTSIRVRYRTNDPLEIPDSLTLLRKAVAAVGERYAVIGHVVADDSTRTVISNGVVLRVDDGGRVDVGTPIVIVPGAGESMAQFAPLLERLRRQRRVITYDIRGHGGSTASTDYSLDAHVGDLWAVVDSLGLGHVTFVGVGTGAIVAAEASRRARERVLGIALIAPSGDYVANQTPHVSVVDSIAREHDTTGSPTSLRPFFAPADSLLLEWVVRDIRQTSRDALLQTLAAAASYDLGSTLATYPGPKLMMLPALPLSTLLPPFATAPDDVARTRRGASRWLHLTSAGELANDLEAFAYVAEWRLRR